MNKIFLSGNYIIIQTATDTLLFGTSRTDVNESGVSFSIFEQGKRADAFSILFADVGDWEDEAGTVYTQATLSEFLRSNTGKVIRANRKTFVWDVSGGDVSAKLNAIPFDGTKMAVQISAVGLDGNIDLDFSGSNIAAFDEDEDGFVIAGGNVIVTPAAPKKKVFEAEFISDYLRCNFVADGATVGIVTVLITSK